MSALLAVDAGGSKTDVVLCDVDGHLLARGRSGGFHPHIVGAEEAVRLLAPTVAGVLEEAGHPQVEHLSACLANVDLPVEERAVRASIDAYSWSQTLDVRNDTFALLRSGTDEPRGVAVVCGTGINAVGLLPDGRTARFAALGRITGDWGGGAGLAVALLWWSVRGEDGRGPETTLASRVAAHFGRPSATAVAEAVHLREISESALLGVVPLLFAAADDGDEIALRLVRRQAQEIVLLAVTALRKLDLLTEPVPVVLGGGVLAGGHALLLDCVREGLAADAPLAQPRVVTAPPVLGAALLGLDDLVTTGRLDRVRATAAEELLRREIRARETRG